MIYFDNAATTLIKPERVISADAYAMRRLCANSGRGSHSPAVRAAAIVYRARRAVCELVGADETVFCFNCTDALNTVILGSARHGHIVTTAYEHNSVLRPIRELSRRGLVSYTIVEPDAGGVIDPTAIERAIRRDTYLIAVNHVSNVTGAVAPVAAIGKIAASRGIRYLVDGAQSVGYIDVDMREIGCDYLCFAPHKGLHGPQGLGCLCVRNGAPLRPIRYGGTGTMSGSIDQPTELPEGFESGTMPVNAIFSLLAAISQRKKLPASKLRELASVGEMLRTGLKSIPGVRLYDSAAAAPNIACFNIEGVDASAVGDILSEQYDIAVRCGLHCAPLCHRYLGTQDSGAVRASLSFHNTAAEVGFFLSAIREIVG